MSATQLNMDYQQATTPDQNLLRGAKAIADKVDWGGIYLPVKSEDLEALQTILSSNTFDTPNFCGVKQIWAVVVLNQCFALHMIMQFNRQKI